jgi:phosphoserine aminotransferase
VEKPQTKPSNPNFSSGPTSKRPGWSVDCLTKSLVGRSHRSKPGKARLKYAIDLSREVAGIPDDYLVGIVPASDTGAYECAMWSLLGARPVTTMAWESFGEGWVTDVLKQLKLDAKVIKAGYGELPNFDEVDWSTDVLFTWNGTTSGVKVPDDKAPPADREGLTLCDATSAVFAMPIPWDRLDVVTWSWQKCLGGEAAHGMLVLSPRAVERIESYTPAWPLPKIFRLGKGGKINTGIFEGATINTPSMICVEDYIDALEWSNGLSFNGQSGLQALFARSQANLAAVEEFVKANDWIDFLAATPETRSSTSICLKVVADWFGKLSDDDQGAFCKKITAALDTEGVVYDCGAYRDAPPGFRFWGGPTVEPDDMKLALQWLAWAYETNRPS